ncbi:MAG TPA: ACP S-malonyltransferase, partial [Clostridia bacterium]|nr:ACP S-malonyltransferase [Clostridia bacterium]
AEAVAGFSLGECSALTASGAVNPATGFQVIRSRAQAMQKAANESKSAMFAIIGAQADAIEDACKNASGYVVPVNYNSPGQIVIAGEEEAAQAAAKILSGTGVRVVRLAVNAAFHSRLMENASKCFHDEIKDFSFSKPAVDFYSNITGDRTLIDDIPEYLKKQMTSPVLFSNEMSSMFRDGIDTFIELGPGKTLCGFIRKGLKGVRALNIEDVKSLEKCLNVLDK